MDTAEKLFWNWAGKVQHEVRTKACSPNFDLEKFYDFELVERMYYDDIDVRTAASNVIERHRWS